MAIKKHLKCPCCGELTISEYGSWEICEVCGWEDDGQSDKDADEVYGGPNGKYSLSEARENYKKFGHFKGPFDT